MRLDIKSRNHLNSVDLSTSDLLEITDPRKAQVYHSRISGAKKANKFGSSVHVYDIDEYAGMRLFMIDDGSAGFALKGDDLVSAFAFPKGKGGTGKDRKQSVISMLLHGIAMGGRRADSFDTILPKTYAHVGMRPVARTPWNDELAKKYMPDWDKELYKDFNNGEPDVIYYAYDPNYHGPYRKGEGKLVTTEEEALEIQQRAVEKFNPEKRPQSPEMDVLQQARQQPSELGLPEAAGWYTDKPTMRQRYPVKFGEEARIDETMFNENLLVYLDKPNTKQMIDRFGKETVGKRHGPITRYDGEFGSWRYIYKDKSGKNIGMVQGVSSPETGDIISNIYVRPDYRRKGIASKMLKAVEKDKTNISIDSGLSQSGALLMGVEAKRGGR